MSSIRSNSQFNLGLDISKNEWSKDDYPHIVYVATKYNDSTLIDANEWLEDNADHQYLTWNQQEHKYVVQPKYQFRKNLRDEDFKHQNLNLLIAFKNVEIAQWFVLKYTGKIGEIVIDPTIRSHKQPQLYPST